MGALNREVYEFSRWAGKRKHVSQMKAYEEKNLWNRLKRVEDWKVNKHAFDRIKEKGINATREDMISTIFNATMIEYKIDYDKKNNKYDERVVLRAKAIVNKCYNLNVVYSLTDNRIVTVWINHIKDKHETLDWSVYNPKMKVFA